MSAPSERTLSPVAILAIIGLGIGMLVFAGGLMIGITIDPRVALHDRLVAYTAGIGGLAFGLGCRCVLSTLPLERKIFAGAALGAFALFVGYGLVML
ncbi:MAG TPA: hypothetical protein VJ694_04660 [Patescibacteria group bacterium]|nr:hypothetical protein [Patescibacteria group bacterium]